MGRHNGTWSPIYGQAWDHPKTLRAVAWLAQHRIRSDIAPFLVLGWLNRLNIWCLGHEESGRVGHLADPRIATIAWPEEVERGARPGPTGAIIRGALHAAGFLEGEGQAERIHEFRDYHSKILRDRQYARLREPSPEPSGEESDEQSHEPSPEQSHEPSGATGTGTGIEEETPPPPFRGQAAPAAVTSGPSSPKPGSAFDQAQDAAGLLTVPEVIDVWNDVAAAAGLPRIRVPGRLEPKVRALLRELGPHGTEDIVSEAFRLFAASAFIREHHYGLANFLPNRDKYTAPAIERIERHEKAQA